MLGLLCLVFSARSVSGAIDYVCVFVCVSVCVCVCVCCHVFTDWLYDKEQFEPDQRGEKIAHTLFVHARDTWDRAVSGQTHIYTHTHTDARVRARR